MQFVQFRFGSIPLSLAHVEVICEILTTFEILHGIGRQHVWWECGTETRYVRCQKFSWMSFRCIMHVRHDDNVCINNSTTYQLIIVVEYLN